ncbi:MAG: hypothetical protein QOE30_5149, partial [Mycobacterium sp.]|nr:hypothetical protein [Mycobacterium sp.]
GLGVGCTTTPLSAAVLQALAPHQVARGTTLVTVNQQVSGSVGAALLGVILTQLFNHNETLVTANRLVAAQQQASGQRLPVEASACWSRAISNSRCTRRRCSPGCFWCRSVSVR